MATTWRQSCHNRPCLVAAATTALVYVSWSSEAAAASLGVGGVVTWCCVVGGVVFWWAVSWYVVVLECMSCRRYRVDVVVLWWWRSAMVASCRRGHPIGVGRVITCGGRVGVWAELPYMVVSACGWSRCVVESVTPRRGVVRRCRWWCPGASAAACGRCRVVVTATWHRCGWCRS